MRSLNTILGQDRRQAKRHKNLEQSASCKDQRHDKEHRFIGDVHKKRPQDHTPLVPYSKLESRGSIVFLRLACMHSCSFSCLSFLSFLVRKKWRYRSREITAFFFIFPLIRTTSIISRRHDKKESHDRAVEDKKSVGGCQQKEVQTYVDRYNE